MKVVGWILLGLFLLGGVVTAVALSPTPHQTILEILRIFISWPLAVTVLGLLAGITFKEDITAYLGRLLRVHFPGGSLEASPAQASPPESTEKETEEMTLEPQQEEQLRATIREHEDALDNAIDKVIEARRAAQLWEFEYLTYFLVPRTKAILSWVSNAKQTTRRAFDQVLRLFTPNASERDTILGVLIYHGLIEENNGVIGPTEKGTKFVHHLNAREPQGWRDAIEHAFDQAATDRTLGQLIKAAADTDGEA